MFFHTTAAATESEHCSPRLRASSDTGQQLSPCHPVDALVIFISYSSRTGQRERSLPPILHASSIYKLTLLKPPLTSLNIPHNVHIVIVSISKSCLNQHLTSIEILLIKWTYPSSARGREEDLQVVLAAWNQCLATKSYRDGQAAGAPCCNSSNSEQQTDIASALLSTTEPPGVQQNMQ